MSAFHVEKMSPDTWCDFEILFDKHKGVRGGCWCMFHRLSSTVFNSLSKDERKAAHYDQVMAGRSAGLILYEGIEPIGWCHYGPASYFEQYDRGRTYKKWDIPPDLQPDWRVACFFVDKDHRKRGLVRLLLGHVLETIQADGGGIVEAFPLVVAGSNKPQYAGKVALFEDFGFDQVTMLGTTQMLMRKRID